ncbi:GH13635 [Drosophila grimshawi]|uniref:GH13635 n=1 Tax=Drosophila grimshawi TaxID=7222 RepID=B4JQ38_DROGR|nr:GH13635 [Drosophila grimshawi]
MSNGDDVLDSWEEIDEAGLCMTLQTKLQTANDDNSSSNLNPTTAAESAAVNKMKLLQRPQNLQESNDSSSSTGTLVAVMPKQIMIAKKPQQSAPTLDADLNTAPVMMVLHKPNSDYDSVNYATPISNQTVKILRRPAQAEERRDSNGMRPKQQSRRCSSANRNTPRRAYAYWAAPKILRMISPFTKFRNQFNRDLQGDNCHMYVTPPSGSPVVVPNSVQAEPSPHPPPPAVNFNNNNSGSVATAPGMHRSNSAPKMSQTAPIYNNYNNYYQALPNPAAMGYFYSQQTPSMHQQQVQQQQQQQQQQTQPPPPHYNQRMSPYITGAPPGPPQTTNPQQSWSPVVGGSVSAALLRQQSLHAPSLQQQHQRVPPLPPYAGHPYNDNVLRLPRGPCPNGTVGFQMRR